MNDSRSSVLERNESASSQPTSPETSSGLRTVIVNEIGERPDGSGSPEIQNKAVEATLLAEEELRVILVSLMLLGMFVVVFMGYLILDAAHML